ncbi:hypothetical protein IGI04_005654 [Brassica rapa subsp. trilocularis]|uniref:PPIase cyclophilin-type domain-containing protein n=1 Tax=Brassica rapa subsp. trilocularis TaxID=1813537 RepID=A0ABQ7NEN3_BRACM|nr:hypothetical protein IGI04_005654 [Brassica rapa subsp. trilocularis]
MANNTRVFLDIAVSSIAVGQIVIEHFAYTNPLTVENFRALCTGEKGIGESDIPLHYKGSVEDSIGFLQASMKKLQETEPRYTENLLLLLALSLSALRSQSRALSLRLKLGSIIHGIDPDHVWFGGYMTQGNGFGGEWIYGDEFPDEECMRKHDRIQFLPHTKEAPDYDEEPPHFAFGQVVNGFDVIKLVERMVANEFVPFFASVNRCLRSDYFPEYVCVDNGRLVRVHFRLYPVASCATEDGGDGDSIGKAKDCI